MNGAMRNILPILVAVTLSISTAAADPVTSQKSTRTAIGAKPLAAKQATARNTCAAYGPGFIKVEGSDTCVKVGGSISLGVGGRR
jgi:hypothetical protein